MTPRALVVRGGWDGHDPVATTDLMADFLEGEGFEVRREDSPAVYADEDAMRGLDVIVQTMTMSTIEDDQLRGLRTAVEAGTGLAGWHGGIADSYRSSADYLQLVGGQFAHHASLPKEQRTGQGSDVFIPHRIELTELGRVDPILQGVDDFDLVTEQYWVLSDSLNDVLATTTVAVMPDEPWTRPIVSPAIWKRQWGQGRIFVATPGHSLEVLRSQPVRTIVERGILWAARRT